MKLSMTLAKIVYLGLAVSVVWACSDVCVRPALAGYQHYQDESSRTPEQNTILDQAAARQYMVTLINRDRASVGAPPVVFDPDLATKAGQMHSDEMAINGYLSHWTMDGRKPDQRYTDLGGRDAVAENAFVSLEGDDAANPNAVPRKLELNSSPVFRKYEVEEMESDYFNEKPPNDGHRVNIIDPNHTAVGVGLSFASSPGAGVRTANAQEFVTKHGEMGEIPHAVVAGDKVLVTGKLSPKVRIVSIDVRWEEAPKPMSIAELNKTSSYGMPENVTATYFPDPEQSNDPIVVKKTGDVEEFSLNLPTSKEWKPGLYYVNVWATVNAGKEDTVISTRTFLLNQSN